METQFPFASRDDIWRVHEEVKDLFAIQAEQEERLSKLERRREDDAKMKSLWGPFSPFPSAVGNSSSHEPAFTPSTEPFRGFDHGPHPGLACPPTLEHEEEPRRGASRANSVRFDESSIHGYYNHANRSAVELGPTRTGSGMGGHSLIERSYSHRSDGKPSSSGHLPRTYSLDTSRGESMSTATTPASQHAPLAPPPGLLILGPVPCIIRCWLTTNFSNDSLLYAAICTGSYSSAVTLPLVQKLGLLDSATMEDGTWTIKLPVYFPEASVCQSSSRSGSPEPHLPALTVRFHIRDVAPKDEKSIAIFIGSDVLRVRNADILFSQDKMFLVDDARNRISIPFVRPEDRKSFKTLSTMPYDSTESPAKPVEVENTSNEVEQTPARMPTEAIGRSQSPQQPTQMKSVLSLRTSTESLGGQTKSRSTHFTDESEDNSTEKTTSRSATTPRVQSYSKTSAKSEDGSGVWGPWRRDAAPTTTSSSKAEPISYVAASQRSLTRRNMKVLKPTKSISRPTPPANFNANPETVPVNPDQPVSRSSSEVFGPKPGEYGDFAGQGVNHSSKSSGDGSWTSKARTTNPIGGASAFGWLTTKSNISHSD
ncbi:hypothetical protein FQN57_003438 [Myotisia sp. PD_48]|nr:hypothetical protein FQN57_003438 [Myotisia sp. PD_48]